MAPLRTEEENAASDDISQQKQMEEFFEWSTGAHHEPETMGQKFKRKTKENPFVPIGELENHFAPSGSAEACTQYCSVVMQ